MSNFLDAAIKTNGHMKVVDYAAAKGVAATTVRGWCTRNTIRSVRVNNTLYLHVGDADKMVDSLPERRDQLASGMRNKKTDPSVGSPAPRSPPPPQLTRVLSTTWLQRQLHLRNVDPSGGHGRSDQDRLLALIAEADAKGDHDRRTGHTLEWLCIRVEEIENHIKAMRPALLLAIGKEIRDALKEVL